MSRLKTNLITKFDCGTGNVIMRELVGSKLSLYNATMQKAARASIIDEVVMEIRATGGRFLKEDSQMSGGFWKEVDIQAARQKVCQTYILPL
jgi:hypothetical protein